MYLLKDLIYTLQPHKKNSKQTLKDTSSTIDLIGGFSWKVAVRYIGEAESERKGDLYRSTYFDTLYIRYGMQDWGWCSERFGWGAEASLGADETMLKQHRNQTIYFGKTKLYSLVRLNYILWFNQTIYFGETKLYSLIRPIFLAWFRPTKKKSFRKILAE